MIFLTSSLFNFATKNVIAKSINQQRQMNNLQRKQSRGNTFEVFSGVPNGRRVVMGWTLRGKKPSNHVFFPTPGLNGKKKKTGSCPTRFSEKSVGKMAKK